MTNGVDGSKKAIAFDHVEIEKDTKYEDAMKEFLEYVINLKSWYTAKGGHKGENCRHAKTKHCEKCQEPECDFARGGMPNKSEYEWFVIHGPTQSKIQGAKRSLQHMIDFIETGSPVTIDMQNHSTIAFALMAIIEKLEECIDEHLSRS